MCIAAQSMLGCGTALASIGITVSVLEPLIKQDLAGRRLKAAAEFCTALGTALIIVSVLW